MEAYLNTRELYCQRASIRDSHTAEAVFRWLTPSFLLGFEKQSCCWIQWVFLYLGWDGWNKFMEPDFFVCLEFPVWGYWYLVGCNPKRHPFKSILLVCRKTFNLKSEIKTWCDTFVQMQWHGWPPKNTPSPYMCYHAEFGLPSPKWPILCRVGR